MEKGLLLLPALVPGARVVLAAGKTWTGAIGNAMCGKKGALYFSCWGTHSYSMSNTE